MTRRGEILSAGRRAFEILESIGAKHRVEGEGYTRVDPFIVAAAEGVAVMVRPLDRLLGAFLREDQPGIIVNSQRSPGLVHLTCAHELGHYFLGHRTTVDESIEYDSSASLIEQQAEYFAYMLLAPRWLVSHLMRRKGLDRASLQNPKVIYQLSLRMGLSYTGAVWSFLRHNLLTLSQAKALARIQPKTIKRELSKEGLKDPMHQDVWLLDMSDRDLILEPRLNDKFVVDLPSNLSAGYLWSVAEAKEEGFSLRPVLVESSNEDFHEDADSSLIGSNKSMRYTLECAQNELPDQAQLQFYESQPWCGLLDEDSRFGLSAHVEKVSLGLTPESKANLLAEVAES